MQKLCAVDRRGQRLRASHQTTPAIAVGRMVRTHPGLLDHAPAPAGPGEHGLGVVIHPGEPTADRLPH
jgi:hypothetical protein